MCWNTVVNQVKEGTVVFTIEPLGATLYIDGARTEYYGKELKLDYGVHQIEVAAGGYTTYKASITVDSERQSLTIYLTENLTEEPGTDPDDPTTDPGTGETERVTVNRRPAAVKQTELSRKTVRKTREIQGIQACPLREEAM